jgi:hypothetical protein
MVSAVVEDRIPALLNGVRERTWDEDGSFSEFEFRRYPIGFPDVLLVERADEGNVAFRIEVKSWYVLSGDVLTARFETAQEAIPEGTLVVIVAWILDGAVSGSPKLLRVYSDDAIRLATVRDQKWAAIGPDHRVQTTDTVARGEIKRDGRWVKDKDNFGKLDRLYDDQLKAYSGSVLALRVAGKTLKEWQTFIKRGERVDDVTKKVRMPTDLNQRARAIVDLATRDKDEDAETEHDVAADALPPTEQFSRRKG